MKITFYPFVVMDIPAGNALPDPWTGASSQPAYPWRGRITCDPAPGQPGSPQGTSAAAAQVANFFSGGAWNYRRMILHYANLVVSAGGVDAFLIGSELKALTRVRSGAGVYPAVDALVTLAADVKAIVGSSTLVTYGADWTEYGADVVDSAEVRFPLDPLWASPAIGAVGIDYYAPLADWRDEAGHRDLAVASSTYDLGYLGGNVAAGEGFDWYYADDAARAAQTRTDITDGLGKPWVFRSKDIWGWWSNLHYERAAHAELITPTAWIPRSKPIWFTEVGCPAVDKGANQPSVFPDPKSSENHAAVFFQRRARRSHPTPHAGSLPRRVRSGLRRRRCAQSGLAALWRAHGRRLRDPSVDLGRAAVSGVSGRQRHLERRAELADRALAHRAARGCAAGCAGRRAARRCRRRRRRYQSALREGCDGYVVDRPMSPRAMIEPLAMAYAFDATAADGTLRFIQRGGAPVAEILGRRSGVAGSRHGGAIDPRAGNRTAARGQFRLHRRGRRLSPLRGDLAKTGRARPAARCIPILP